MVNKIIMECYNCQKGIRKDNTSKLCTDCKSCPFLFISLRETSSTFKLTWDELNEAKVFKYSYLAFHSESTKYLRKEVEELAAKITKDLPDNNPKRIAYLKFINREKEQRDKITKIAIRRMNIEEQLSILLTKYDREIDLNGWPKYKTLLKSYSEDFELPEYYAAMQINNFLYEREQRMDMRRGRRKELMKVIRKKINPNYIAFVQDLTEYQDWIKFGQGCLITVMKKITDHVNKKMLLDSRTEEINKELSLANIQFNQIVDKMHYEKFITGKINLAYAIEKIKSDYERNLREKKISKSIEEQNIPINIIKNPFYLKYIDGKLELDETIKLIQEQIERDKKINITHEKLMLYFCSQGYPFHKFDILKSKYFEEYMDKKISWEDTIIGFKEEYKNDDLVLLTNSFQKWQYINVFKNYNKKALDDFIRKIYPTKAEEIMRTGDYHKYREDPIMTLEEFKAKIDSKIDIKFSKEWKDWRSKNYIPERINAWTANFLDDQLFKFVVSTKKGITISDLPKGQKKYVAKRCEQLNLFCQKHKRSVTIRKKGYGKNSFI